MFGVKDKEQFAKHKIQIMTKEKKWQNPKLLKPTTSNSSSSEAQPRTVKKETVEKWKSELVNFYAHEWLQYETDSHGKVTCIKCKVDPIWG